jgi:multiple sugar transport system substrate-binding protein
MAINRRQFLLGAGGLAAAAATGGLTACAPGSSGGGGGGSTDKNTLALAYWSNPTRTKNTDAEIAAFVKANPPLKINAQPGEFGTYWDKLATQTAGGTAPDIIQMDMAYIADYGSRSALLDLTKYGVDTSKFVAGTVDPGKINGTLVGVNAGINSALFFANPKVFEKAKMNMPDDKTWTWDDLANLSAQVSAKLGDKGVYGFDGFGTGTAELGAWARQRGEEVWPTGNQTPVSAATITSYFDYAQKLIQTKATPAAAKQVENSTAALDASLFATNKAAFHLLFHTQISAFGAASGTELKLLRLPAVQAGEPKMVNKASMYWSISARSKHTEAASKLIDFLMTDPAATKILTTERGIPAIPAVQKDVAPLLDPQSKIALDFSQAIAPELVPPPQVTPANASGFSTEFTTIGTDVIFGRSSSADAAAKTLSTIQGMK